MVKVVLPNNNKTTLIVLDFNYKAIKYLFNYKFIWFLKLFGDYNSAYKILKEMVLAST